MSPGGMMVDDGGMITFWRLPMLHDVVAVTIRRFAVCATESSPDANLNLSLGHIWPPLEATFEATFGPLWGPLLRPHLRQHLGHF